VWYSCRRTVNALHYNWQAAAVGFNSLTTHHSRKTTRNHQRVLSNLVIRNEVNSDDVGVG